MIRVPDTSWKPSSAALPVSPEVAVRITIPDPSCLAAALTSRGSTDRATSLKALVGPWYSSSTYRSPHRHQRRQVIAGEFSGIAGPHQSVHILKVRQQCTQNVRRHGHGILLQGPCQSKSSFPGSQTYSPPSGAMPSKTALVGAAVSFSSLVLW